MRKILTLAFVCGLFTAPAFAAEPSKPAAAPAPASAAAEPTQATSEGALKLFAKSMKEGNFKRVVELCDPGSEGFDDFQKMAEMLDPATRNEKMSQQEFDFIRGLFTNPWQDVEHKLVAEQGPRAQYSLSFFSTDPKTKERVETGKRNVDLNRIQDEWFLIVTPELISPAKPDAAPAPAVPAPAPEKPAEAPAKQ